MKRINIILGVIFLIIIVSACTQNNQDPNKLYSVKGFAHGHGLATDVSDPNKLYIATHHGLFVLMNEKELYQIGRSQDDFMGFSAHPTQSNIVYTSGHPKTGGNLGFQKSEDGGFIWRKISKGFDGDVDFHAMSVSPINPNVIYGWYKGILQRSDDEGKNWKAISETGFPIVSLAADTKDENKVYAASPQGLFVSSDKGKTWNVIEEFQGKFVSAIAISPKNSTNLLVFSGDKLLRSKDSGNSFEEITQNFNEGTVLYITFNKQDSSTIYSLTEKNEIFRSNDSGNTWSKIY